MTRRRVSMPSGTLVGKMNRRRNPVAQRGEFQHRNIETAPVETYHRSGEAFRPAPEFADQFFFRVIRSRESVDGVENVIIADVSDRDRNRQMQGDGKEIAAATVAQIVAVTMERIVVSELLTFEVNLVEQVLIDPGLDVEDRERHQPLWPSRPAIIFAATD